jgi:hypothetical protein
MGSIAGRIEPNGPFINVTLMQTSQHVARVKAAKLPPAAPVTVRALVDTGASASAIDSNIVRQLGLNQTGRSLVHTPAGYVERDQFDASVFFGSQAGDVKSFTIGVVSTDLASEGFAAIIGWDILIRCVLTCDGPAGSFRLDY